MLNKLDLCTPEEKRRRSRLIFMLKIIHGLVDIKIETHTRSSLRLKLLEPHCKKDVFKLSFFLRSARDWNQLLPDMPHISSLEEFKNYLGEFFYFYSTYCCMQFLLLYFVNYVWCVA